MRQTVQSRQRKEHCDKNSAKNKVKIDTTRKDKDRETNINDLRPRQKTTTSFLGCGFMHIH